MGFETILFLVLGVMAIFSAAAMVYFKNTVHSALFLIVNFGCVAFLYLMLDAPFISMVQITVYAGAIMVLFLFVIMLLGGEQTTDMFQNSGRFKWLPAAATVLAVLFIAVPVGMALLQIRLPEAPGADPQLRVVHAANTGDVDVTVSGANLAEPLVLEDVAFSAISDFMTLEAGDYTVTLSNADGTALEQSITLANNDIITAIAHGDETLTLTQVPLDLSPTEADSARVQVVNLLDTPVLLADLGRNARLDTTTRNATNAEGQLLDAEGNVIADPTAEGAAAPAQVAAIADNTLFTDVAPLTVSEAVAEIEGTKSLAFYTFDGDTFVPVASLNDWEVREGTTQLLVLTPDYASVPDAAGIYRPRVLDREQSALTITALEQFGSPKDIGNYLFTSYLLPVNLVGFLLLVALIGVIVLTRPVVLSGEKRSTVNRRRKVSRPLVSVISQQTGQDVVVDVPRLQEPQNEE
jgi:NADH:ubiquinone oxidoreductase subunit 6 (subunit J)